MWKPQILHSFYLLIYLFIHTHSLINDAVGRSNYTASNWENYERIIRFTEFGKNLSWPNLNSYFGICLAIFRKTTFPDYDVLPTRSRRSVNCFQICYMDTGGGGGRKYMLRTDTLKLKYMQAWMWHIGIFSHKDVPQFHAQSYDNFQWTII
jgi:hypothetical protein